MASRPGRQGFALRAYRFALRAYRFALRAYRLLLRAYRFALRAYRLLLTAIEQNVGMPTAWSEGRCVYTTVPRLCC